MGKQSKTPLRLGAGAAYVIDRLMEVAHVSGEIRSSCFHCITHHSIAIMRIISSSCSRSYLLRVIPVCHFSLSPPRSASEVPRDPFADPTVQSFYEKIRNHQGAVDAMMDMRKIMEEKGLCVLVRSDITLMQDTGYDVTKPPSTMQMMKMGLDGDLRKGVQKVGLALQLTWSVY